MTGEPKPGLGKSVAALGPAAFARDAPDPLDPKKRQCRNPNAEPDREPDALVRHGEVRRGVGNPGIDGKTDDGHQRSQEEGGHSRRQAHQERLKPAKISHGNPEECALAAGLIDMMRRGHLPVEYLDGRKYGRRTWRDVDQSIAGSARGRGAPVAQWRALCDLR